MTIHDLYNIQVYAVIFVDYGVYTVTFVAKLFTKCYSFNCIRPMLNFLIMRYLLHREQCSNIKLAGKAWTEVFAVQ